MEAISLKWVSPFWYLGCDQNCPECFIGDKKSQVVTPLTERKKAIDVLANAGTEQVLYCGGNPILDPLIEETVHYTKKNGMLVELLSNSWDIEKNTSIKDPKLFLDNIDSKAATFWGGEATTHDSACACPGSFERLTRNLERLSNQNYEIHGLINVLPANKTKIYKTIATLKSRINLTRVWLQRIFPYGNALKNDYRSMMLLPDDFNPVLDQLVRAKNDFQLEEISFDITPPFCLVNKKYHPYLERYKRGLSFWALDHKCRLFGESFDVTKPELSLLHQRPIYDVPDLMDAIRRDPRTQEILAKKYLPPECRKCDIKDCFGGYLSRDKTGSLTIDPVLFYRKNKT